MLKKAIISLLSVGAIIGFGLLLRYDYHQAIAGEEYPTIHGILTLKARAMGDKPTIILFVDKHEVAEGKQESDNPVMFDINWDTHGVADGPHLLTVKAIKGHDTIGEESHLAIVKNKSN